MRLLLIVITTLTSTLAFAYEPLGADGKPVHITRGIYCSAGPLLSTAYWGSYSGDHSFTTETAHGGATSVKVVNTTADPTGSGVWQAVLLNQAAAVPIKISGWSKALAVSEGLADWRYSIYIDFIYQDGTHWPMQIAPFAGGTHDWQYVERIVKPEKPVLSGRVYVFVRSRTGTAYFDDLFVGAADGPNLLRNAGFEPDDRDDRASQAAVYQTYTDLNANAIHTYMSGNPRFWQGADGADAGVRQGSAEVRRFLADAKAHNLGVWLTTAEPERPAIKSASDPNFPEYLCVNGPWGAAWTETLRLAAGYDFAGISLVPDEYNWTNDPLRARYGEHADPQVAAFYRQLPEMCNCPVCAARYEKTYGEKLPPLERGMSFPDTTLPYLRYLQQRYDSTTDWMARSVRAIKGVNPRLRTDSLICVSPICSDDWWGPGVAWDKLNRANLDFPTTDPYILLHNYLGDSTHWYATETAAHLTAATPQRQCGIVMEGSRLRQEDRELDPVEIYGSALSAVCHGAKELAWWHFDHLTDRTKTTERADVSRAAVKGVYGLLKQADPWLGGLRTPKLVACLYSRASDDAWRLYATRPEGRGTSPRPTDDPRHANVAQKEVLYYLFRRGIPTDLYYLEAAQEQQLKDYRVIIVPFPFAIDDRQVALLQKLAASGKTVVVIGARGELDEIGVRRQSAALDSAGKIIFLDEACGYGLPLNRDNQKRTRTARIQPDPLNPAGVARLDEAILKGCGLAPWTLGRMTNADVEATSLVNAAGEPVVLAINWESTPQTVELRVPLGRAKTFTGFRLGPDGKLTPSTMKGATTSGGVRMTVQLKPQEACLWRGKSQ